MKVLTPYTRRREDAPDSPCLLAPERASEPIDGDAEVVLPPALRRERPPPVAFTQPELVSPINDVQAALRPSRKGTPSLPVERDAPQECFAYSLGFNVPIEDEAREVVLSGVAVGLPSLGRVDAGDADGVLRLAVQHYKGIAVLESDNAAGEYPLGAMSTLARVQTPQLPRGGV